MVQYKKKGSVAWKQAFIPTYDSFDKEFRLSIVRLEEDTEYEVNIVLLKEGETFKEFNSSFKTWTSNPPIGKVINISSISLNPDNGLSINNLKGNPLSWIKVVGDIPINAGNKNEAAILINNSEYIIFENLTVTGGKKHAIKTYEKANNIRFINCDISKWGRISTRQDITGKYLDDEGNTINNDAGLSIYRSGNIVMERSYIHDPNGNTNPWAGTIELGEYAGQSYKGTHPEGPNAVYVMEGGGGIVLRYNDFIGSETHRFNDVIEGWRNKDIEGGLAKDADVYGNVLAFSQDDAIELDGGQCNVRFYDNRAEQNYCIISTAPNKKGPSYIFNNVLWNMGDSENKTGNAIKNGGGIEHTFGFQYLFNNTVIHDGGGMVGVGYGSSTPENKRELFNAYTRNNIFLAINNRRKGYSINDVHKNELCDFDYDMLGDITDAEGRGVVVAAEGAEDHGVFAVPSFTNIESGILTLAQDDKGIGKGAFVYGFSESNSQSTSFMGAFAPGESSLMPKRPLDMEADKYYVKMKNDVPEKIKIRIGNVDNPCFQIKMSEDMYKWLTVKPKIERIQPNTTLELILTAKEVPYRQNGMIFIRLADGFSLPITVLVED